jgi:ferredoxin
MLKITLSKTGYTNIIMTSNYIADIDDSKCRSCGKCIESCPVNAMEKSKHGTGTRISVKDDVCLGCGVCSRICSYSAVRLTARKQRIMYPEDTFEKVILQSLEKGTLQYQLFDNPKSLTQGFLRGFIGGFLKLPFVKKTLLSDNLRSTFLHTLKQGVISQGKEHLIF